MLRIINTIMIHDQGIHNGTEFEQPMPLASVARQARRLDGENGADLALAHVRHQGSKSRTLNVSASGAAQIIVDDTRLAPAKLSGALHQSVLTPLALDVVLHL